MKKFSLIVKANLENFLYTKTLIQINQNAALQIYLISSTKKIMKDLK